MKIVPKFQRGGGLESLFTVYTPTQPLTTRQTSLTLRSASSRSSRSDEEKEEKGKLTEKDLFNMIKEIDGLPNEMSALVSNLMNTFKLSLLSGVDLNDLATTYLQSLYKIKIAALNKKKYDEAIKTAKDNGAMAEPAISMDGRLVVLDKNGKINYVSLKLYQDSSDLYNVLSVSLLANLRAYQPQLNNNLEIFNIINNSMGYESFQALLKQGIESLGHSERKGNQLYTLQGLAIKGLLVLLNLTPELRTAIMTGTILQNTVTNELLTLIQALTQYLTTVLPNRAKTWAALKLGITDKNTATAKLIQLNLTAKATDSLSIITDYNTFFNQNETLAGVARQQAKDAAKEKTGGGGSEPNEGFWRLIQSDKGGSDSSFLLLKGTGSMSVDAKFYGLTPGLDHDKSLLQFIADSNAGYIFKDNRAITFGDIKLSLDSFNDVMVQASSGAMVATLPINADGTVNLELVKDYQGIVNNVKASGYKEGSYEYAQALGKLLKENKLDILVDLSTGLPNQRYFGHFMILDGLSSSKARGVLGTSKQSLDKFESDFITRDDDSAQQLINGLSSKTTAYDLDTKDWADLWLDALSDQVYRGIIYIPLNTNPINGFNADNNNIKVSLAREMEKATQAYNRQTKSTLLL